MKSLKVLMLIRQMHLNNVLFVTIGTFKKRVQVSISNQQSTMDVIMYHIY